MPPLLFGGVRITIAGLIILSVLLLRGQPILLPSGSRLPVALCGVLLFVGGNGMINVAGQTLDSGLCAVLIATTPLWVGLFELLCPRGDRLTLRGWVGLLLGVAGVLILCVPKFQDATNLMANAGVFAALVSAASWAVGSLVSRYRRVQCPHLLAAAYQMVLGGASLTTVGLSMGELGRMPDQIAAEAIRRIPLAADFRLPGGVHRVQLVAGQRFRHARRHVCLCQPRYRSRDRHRLRRTSERLAVGGYCRHLVRCRPVARRPATRRTEVVLPAQLEDNLRSIVGSDGVLASPSDLLVYECDGFTIEKNKPDIVVFPRSTDQVVRIVQACNAAGVPFLPRGAGTSLAGGCLPVGGGVMIALTRMKRILEVNLRGRYAVVEPGVVNIWLTNQVKSQGWHFAPDPSSQGACTIGGNVATNSGGPHTLKYGVTVNHVLGLEMVLPDGSVLHTGGPVEDAPATTSPASSSARREHSASQPR